MLSAVLHVVMNDVSREAVETNTKIVRRLYGSFAEGDIDAVRTLVDPDVELREPQGIVGGGTIRGFDEIVENVFEGLANDWEDISVTPERFVAEAETVVALLTWSGTYRATGKSVTYRGAHVFDFEDGAIVRWTSYADTALFNAALED